MKKAFHAGIASFVLLGLAACKTSSRERNPEPPAPIVPRQAVDFDTAQLTYKSFKSVPIEKRCEGLLLFVQEFLQRDGKGMTLSNNTRCQYETHQTSAVSNVMSLSLERPPERLQLQVFFRDRADPGSLEFKILELTAKYAEFNPEQPKSQMEADLINLDPTFRRWLSSPEGELTIHGMPYANFLANFHQNYSNADNPRNAIDNPLLKLVFKPSASDPSSGSIQFIEIDSAHYQGKLPRFLGCPEISCLNDGQSAFAIVDDVLTIYRRAPVAIPNSTRTARWNIVYRIGTQGLTEMGRPLTEISN